MPTANPIIVLPRRKYLAECFVYTRTGELRWKRRPRTHFPKEKEWRRWNSRYAGTQAGALKPDGYRDIGIDGVLHKAHRIVWKLVRDKEPPEFLDHIDGDRDNNRLGNLRPANRTQQKWNSHLYKNNLSGRRGVSPRGAKYIARIRVHGILVHLGTFKSIAAAAAAYEAVARKLHRGFYREH
jgi:hypothetical protein